MSARRSRVGEPCPNGCTERELDGRMVPSLLEEACPGAGDGEITCMVCWDAWQAEVGDNAHLTS